MYVNCSNYSQIIIPIKTDIFTYFHVDMNPSSLIGQFANQAKCHAGVPGSQLLSSWWSIFGDITAQRSKQTTKIHVKVTQEENPNGPKLKQFLWRMFQQLSEWKKVTE